jgi:hypothetical protein
VTPVVKADMSDITVGKFVGIAALPQGSEPEKALEVLIFPESARGSGEGHYAWDLMPESTMTDATIADAVDKIDGRTLTLKHKNGETGSPCRTTSRSSPSPPATAPCSSPMPGLWSPPSSSRTAR